MPSFKRVLGLDIATTVGWGFTAPADRRPILSSKRLVSGPVGDDHGRAYLALSRLLGELMQVGGPFDCIAYEAPIQIGGDGERARSSVTELLLMGYCAVVELEAARWDIPCFGTNIQAVRKWFCGVGRTPKGAKLHVKDMVFNECVRRGWRPNDTDASDAGAVWAFADANLNGPMPTEDLLARAAQQ